MRKSGVKNVLRWEEIKPSIFSPLSLSPSQKIFCPPPPLLSNMEVGWCCLSFSLLTVEISAQEELPENSQRGRKYYVRYYLVAAKHPLQSLTHKSQDSPPPFSHGFISSRSEWGNLLSLPHFLIFSLLPSRVLIVQQNIVQYLWDVTHGDFRKLALKLDVTVCVSTVPVCGRQYSTSL